jgi:hypothetical protein
MFLHQMIGANSEGRLTMVTTLYIAKVLVHPMQDDQAPSDVYLFADYSDALQSFKQTYREHGRIITNTLPEGDVDVSLLGQGMSEPSYVGRITPIDKMVVNRMPVSFF